MGAACSEALSRIGVAFGPKGPVADVSTCFVPAIGGERRPRVRALWPGASGGVLAGRGPMPLAIGLDRAAFVRWLAGWRMP
eukprot:CAMPEP_0179023202 /NCGR_PEP_ID=MMETSP0796-20121207/6805_1 /TAXON_ID=73915 /ORGANISM="Pyrodinium bahamense, Strain pbaha01" /LENGTH=80 /DNA_ID=CAMNT_0020719099 /DNA_START=99 /DNA_END=338 /DNA_ORIENTATION=+